MLARIGVVLALHRHHRPALAPRQKHVQDRHLTLPQKITRAARPARAAC
jgi:hypothetical protein